MKKESNQKSILLPPHKIQRLKQGLPLQIRVRLPHQPPTPDYELSLLVDTTGDRKNVDKYHWILRDDLTVLKSDENYFPLPFGFNGTVHRVLETWCVESKYRDVKPSDLRPTRPVKFKADDLDSGDLIFFGKWRTPNTLPAWASRFYVEVESYRTERLHAIKYEDYLVEGIYSERFRPDFSAKEHSQIARNHFFKPYWIKKYGMDSWNSDPFVWVATLKLAEQPAGQVCR